MRFRRQWESTGQTVAVLDGDRWVSLRAALIEAEADAGEVLGAAPDDLVGILSGGEQTRLRIADLCASFSAPAAAVEPMATPFDPVGLRCFSEWQQHWEQAARALARRYHPLRRAAGPLIDGYRAVTRKTFPPLRPGKEFFTNPTYYLGNPLNVIGDGEETPWPSTCRDLDYELELGALIVRPLLDADEATALAAVGGFFVLNDFSARDIQWREHTAGQFGPVVKTKGFATAISAEVVSPDEVLPRLDALTASVTVDGEEWARTSTAGMRNGLAGMAAWASAGERVHPGEVLATGTLPNGSGLEIERWLHEGAVITLEIEGVGSLSNRIGTRPTGNAR